MPGPGEDAIAVTVTLTVDDIEPVSGLLPAYRMVAFGGFIACLVPLVLPFQLDPLRLLVARAGVSAILVLIGWWYLGVFLRRESAGLAEAETAIFRLAVGRHGVFLEDRFERREYLPGEVARFLETDEAYLLNLPDGTRIVPKRHLPASQQERFRRRLVQLLGEPERGWPVDGAAALSIALLVALTLAVALHVPSLTPGS